MKELKITDDRVKEAAKECPTAKAILEKLFPEVFDIKDFKVGDIVEYVGGGMPSDTPSYKGSVGFVMEVHHASQPDAKVGYFYGPAVKDRGSLPFVGNAYFTNLRFLHRPKGDC